MIVARYKTRTKYSILSLCILTGIVILLDPQQAQAGSEKECSAAFVDKVTTSCIGKICSSVTKKWTAFRQRQKASTQAHRDEQIWQSLAPLISKLELIRKGNFKFGEDLINLETELVNANPSIKDAFIETAIHRRSQASQAAAILADNPYALLGTVKRLTEIALDPSYPVNQRTNAALIWAQTGERGQPHMLRFLESTKEQLSNGLEVSINHLYVMTEVLFFYVSKAKWKTPPNHSGRHSFEHIDPLRISNSPREALAPEILELIGNITNLSMKFPRLAAIASVNHGYAEFLKLLTSGSDITIESQRMTSPRESELELASQSPHDWIRLHALNVSFLSGRHSLAIPIATKLLADPQPQTYTLALKSISEIVLFAAANPNYRTDIINAFRTASTLTVLEAEAHKLVTIRGEIYPEAVAGVKHLLTNY